MEAYRLVVKESVEKDLKKIPKSLLKNVIKKLTNLGNNPFQYGYIKLSGSDEFYRIRVGDYRILYSVDTKQKIVIVNYVRHRKDVYKVI